MKGLEIKPDFSTEQVTRCAQLFCETLLLADVILLRCGRKSKGGAKEAQTSPEETPVHPTPQAGSSSLLLPAQHTL